MSDETIVNNSDNDEISLNTDNDEKINTDGEETINSNNDKNDQIICPECKEIIYPGQTVCPKCGCPIDENKKVINQSFTSENTVSQNNSSNKKSKKGLIIAAVIALVVLVVGIVGFVVYKNAITPKSIEIISDIDNLLVDDEYDLSCTILPKTAKADVFWSSSDNSILEIDQNGRIKAKHDGIATITVTTGDLTATKEVKVCTLVGDWEAYSFFSYDSKKTYYVKDHPQLASYFKCDGETGIYYYQDYSDGDTGPIKLLDYDDGVGNYSWEDKGYANYIVIESRNKMTFATTDFIGCFERK